MLMLRQVSFLYFLYYTFLQPSVFGTVCVPVGHIRLSHLRRTLELGWKLLLKLLLNEVMEACRCHLHHFIHSPVHLSLFSPDRCVSLKLHDEDDEGDDEEEVAAEASCSDPGPVRCEQQPEETQQRAERRASSCSWGQM